MKLVRSKTTEYIFLVILALLFLAANTYLVISVDAFGNPSFFALGLLFQLILLVVILYWLIRALNTPLVILVSILISAWSGALTNSYVKQFRKSKSPFSRWLIARLNYKNPSGLVLTIGLIISVFFLINFSGILLDVWFHKPLTQIDTRVINLMPSIRTSSQTAFFRFVTFTANTESILVLGALTAGILWNKRQKIAAGLFIIAIFTEEIFSLLLKLLVGRVRPIQSLGLIHEDTFSFPSGHVLRATVLFGLLSYLIYRSYNSSVIRICIILGFLLSVALVALSRIYLGVHYPSDVLASMFFGASILTIFITIIEIATRYNLWKSQSKSFTNKWLLSVPTIVIIFSLLTSPFILKITPSSTKVSPTLVSSIDNRVLNELPHFSETLTGKPMEPISFIYIGSRQQIEARFSSHGWYKADASTVFNTLRALSIGLQNRQYLNAPVTPSYLNAQPENIAFQNPTRTRSLRQRHHTRLWRTNFQLSDGREIWVATASYDDRIEFAGPAKLPTHHIDPNIDAERSFILKSLEIKNSMYVQVVKAQAGQNASGDIFFTDGKAAVVEL